MVVINLETASKSTSKARKILDTLNPISDTFINHIQKHYNTYFANTVLKNRDATWQQLIDNIKPNQVRPVLYSAIKQLWESSWNIGSTDAREDLKPIYDNITKRNFSDAVQLITFAKDNDNTIKRLRDQIQSLIYKQEDNASRLEQLNRDIINPDRYAKVRLRQSNLNPDQRNTVVNILTEQANSIKAEQNQLKQKQNALVYQLSRAASGESVAPPKQLDMLSRDDVRQLQQEKRARTQAKRVSAAEQQAERRQQTLLRPLTPTSSSLSKTSSAIRARRIQESEITRDVSKRLKKPITLANETEFAQYLDKRYNDLAQKLTKDITDSTKRNIKQYTDGIANTRSKISNYLASTKHTRERDLIRALSSMYPDYGVEARKILRETKSQKIERRLVTAVKDNIVNLERSLEAYKRVGNTQKVEQLQKELNRERNKLNDDILLNSEQARRLGFPEKEKTISRQELEKISQRRSALPSIKRTALTELSAAYNYGRYAHYANDNTIELVRWNASIEHLRMNNSKTRRKSGKLKRNYSGTGVVCDRCLRLADQDIGYGKGVYPFKLFQTGQMLPPPNPHPYCACYLEPVEGRAKAFPLTAAKLAAASVLGGATIASIALLNSMFNKTRPPVAPINLYDVIENVSRPVLQRLENSDVGNVIRQASEVYDLVELIHEDFNRLKLQAPPNISDTLNLATEQERETANQILEQLENPTKTVKSKFDSSVTIRGRNGKILNEASRALGNDINVLNKAQVLAGESEIIRQQFESRFQAAQGNTKLQAALLSDYTKYISTVTKTINDLGVSQIKMVNTLNAAKTALEETKDTMQRYRVAEELSPGIVDSTNLVNNTSTVRRLTDQANTLYNNILDTQVTRQTYRDTLKGTRDNLLSNPEVANAYLTQKAKELNFIDTIFEPSVGRITLSTNLDTAEEYIRVVQQRIANKATTNPVEYEQSIKDLVNASEELSKIRSATQDIGLDFDLLSSATQNPTIRINNQPTIIPFTQEQVSRVKSRFDTLSKLEADVNNLQAELSMLKSNSPKARDQLSINPRQLEKQSRLNELTREMGSLIYEQQRLNPTNPRYLEIDNYLRDLNTQRREIETAYFKQNIATLGILSPKKRITVNGYKK
jgi:hypothetical protein